MMVKTNAKKKKRRTFASHAVTLTPLLAILALVFILLTFIDDYRSTGNMDHTFSQIQTQLNKGLDVLSDVFRSNKDSSPDKTIPARTHPDIPPYTGSGSYVCLNNNIPYFTESERNAEPFEYYSRLDRLGRCQAAEAKISRDLMPTEERSRLGMIRPAGWHNVKYPIIDGLYLYNRCHLIGYQLTGENANERNLITGTRYLNVVGMLPWENLVTDYIQRTGNTVLYRVTPIYTGDNLIADGVQMEALSVEDSEISFNIFVYNIQPGIGIDYKTGDSWLL